MHQLVGVIPPAMSLSLVCSLDFILGAICCIPYCFFQYTSGLETECPSCWYVILHQVFVEGMVSLQPDMNVAAETSSLQLYTIATLKIINVALEGFLLLHLAREEIVDVLLKLLLREILVIKNIADLLKVPKGP